MPDTPSDDGNHVTAAGVAADPAMVGEQHRLGRYQLMTRNAHLTWWHYLRILQLSTIGAAAAILVAFGLGVIGGALGLVVAAGVLTVSLLVVLVAVIGASRALLDLGVWQPGAKRRKYWYSNWYWYSDGFILVANGQIDGESRPKVIRWEDVVALDVWNNERDEFRSCTVRDRIGNSVSGEEELAHRATRRLDPKAIKVHHPDPYAGGYSCGV